MLPLAFLRLNKRHVSRPTLVPVSAAVRLGSTHLSRSPAGRRTMVGERRATQRGHSPAYYGLQDGRPSSMKHSAGAISRTSEPSERMT